MKEQPVRKEAKLVTFGLIAADPIDRSGPDSSEFIYVDISSIDRIAKRIVDAKPVNAEAAPSRAKQRLQAGDVLVSMTRPNLNAVALVTPEFDGAIGSTGFHILRTRYAEPKFLFYLVQTREFIDSMSLVVQGALYPAVRPKDIESFSFVLPPLNEQRRIVAKIEELFSELDKGIENLKTAREQLKVYRQALLKHAFEGKLTAQWRAANPDKLEPAAALLARIQTEREQRYQQQLQQWQTTGGGKPKAPKPLPPLTAEELAELPELPEGWGWVRLEALVSGVDQGWSPKCEGQPATDTEWGVIKTTAIQHGRFDSHENKALPHGMEPREQHELRPGDILVTRAGPRVRVGVCCLVRTVRNRLMNCDKAYRIRAIDSLCRSDYLEAVLNSPSTLDVIERIKSGINDSGVNLNQGAFLGLIVPFCGLEEQKALIQELELKLSEADQLDQTLTTSLQQSEALRQSILKRAFSGQLVAQDPHDEPASILLDRVRVERERVAAPKRNRRNA